MRRKSKPRRRPRRRRPPTPGGGGGERQRRPSHRGDRAPEQKREGFREATRRFGSEADRPREPLKPSVAERKRKHVSALRAEIAGDAGETANASFAARPRTARAAKDAVERLTPTQATLRKRADAAAKTSRPRARFSAKGQGARGESGDRLAGRFGGAERSRDAAPQGRQIQGATAAPDAAARDDRPRGEGRPERFADKPVSGRETQARNSGAEARPRRDDRPRGERSTSGERPFTGRNKHQRAKRDDQRPGRAGARPEGAAGRPPRRGPARDRPSPGGRPRPPPPAAETLSDARGRRKVPRPTARRRLHARISRPRSAFAESIFDILAHRYPPVDRRGAGRRSLRRLRGRSPSRLCRAARVSSVRRQRGGSARPASRQCRKPGPRRRHPHLAGRCDEARQSAERRPLVHARLSGGCFASFISRLSFASSRKYGLRPPLRSRPTRSGRGRE